LFEQAEHFVFLTFVKSIEKKLILDRKIKLIWDFKGPTGLGTAKHHCIHLKEFAEQEKLPFYKIEFLEISDLHAIAYIIVDESDMKTYRDALKPHRGELAK